MKAKNYFLNMFFAFCMGCVVVSCGDDPIEPKPTPKPPFEEESRLVGMLHEGTWGKNNAMMTFYDTEKQTVDAPILFSNLGDVAQDAMLGSDGYIYIVVSNSKTLLITEYNPNSVVSGFRSERLKLEHQPRYITEADGYVYISCYGGYIVRMDMKTMEMTELKLQGGENLEGIAALDGKLYVCNSYSVDADYQYTYLTELLTVDLKTFTQTESVQTVMNPNYLCVLEGKLFCLGFGNFAGVPNQIGILDTATGKSTVLANANKMGVWDGKLVFSHTQTDWGTNKSVTKFGHYDVRTNTIDELSLNDKLSAYSSIPVHMIQGDPVTGDLYLSTADYTNTSTVYRFDKTVTFRSSFDSKGINCNRLIFLDNN